MINWDVTDLNPPFGSPMERACAARFEIDNLLAEFSGLFFGLVPATFATRDGLLTNGPFCEKTFRELPRLEGLDLTLAPDIDPFIQAFSFLEDLADGLLTNGPLCG
jgi:hypothetical protein